MCFHPRTRRLFYKQNSGASFVILMATFFEGGSWQALEAGAISILGRSRPYLYSGAGHPQHSDGKKKEWKATSLDIFKLKFPTHLSPLWGLPSSFCWCWAFSCVPASRSLFTWRCLNLLPGQEGAAQDVALLWRVQDSSYKRPMKRCLKS